MNYLIFINVLIFDWDNILTGNVFMATPLAALRLNFHGYASLWLGGLLCALYIPAVFSLLASFGLQHEVSAQSTSRNKKITTQYELEFCSEPNELAN